MRLAWKSRHSIALKSVAGRGAADAEMLSPLLLRHDLYQRRRHHALLLRCLGHLDRDQLGERLVVAPAPPLAFQPHREVLALDPHRHATPPRLPGDERPQLL